MTELYKFENKLGYLKALDSALPENFLEERSGNKYYSIVSKQAVADDIFHYWNVTDEKYINIANELICTVTINYMPGYPGADELHCTGSAAVPIQMDKGAEVLDFPAKKKKNALEYNVPSVRSEAIGNALLTLGNIFGRSLNRKIKKLDVANDFSFRKYSDEKKKEPVVEENKTEVSFEPKNKNVKVPF